MRRIRGYRERLDDVVAQNRAAISRLFGSGLTFTREGGRATRSLLVAQEHLARVSILLDRLEQKGDVPAPRTAAEIDSVFDELEELLRRTDVLTSRTGTYLQQLKKQ